MATDLETASVRDTASPSQQQPRGGKSRGPVAALCLVTIAAFALYALLSLPVGGPRVHPDEVRYLIDFIRTSSRGVGLRRPIRRLEELVEE